MSRQTRRRSGLARAGAALLAGSVVALAPAVQAGAFGSPPPPPPPPAPSPPPPAPAPPPVTPPSNPAPPSGSVRDETFREGTRVCRAVAGPRYIGAVCTNGSGGTPIEVIIEQMLAGDPLPECWHERLTDEELRSLDLTRIEGEGAWHWVKCLGGVNPETFEVDPDGAFIEMWYQRIADEEIITLTDNQRSVVDHLARDRFIPAPILGSSPYAVPVVNQDISFYNAGAEFGDDEVLIVVGEMGLQMRASVVGLSVDTGEDTTVSCAGNGYRAREGETRDDYPAGCWHSYEGSSLGLENDAFESQVTARWRVEINHGAGWEYFHEFDKVANHRIQVNEIQGIVVP